MKALKILLVILLILAGGALFAVNHYLQSPAFRETALAAARTALGAQVTLDELTISLFRGVTLRGIKVANPAGFDGYLVEAQAFTLRYRLWPLLRKRVEIARLTLEHPNIQLLRNPQGAWNYEQLGAGPATSRTPAAAPDTPARRVGGFELSLEQLALTDAVIEMHAEDGQRLLAVEDLDVASTLDLVGQRLEGRGQASMRRLNLADALMITNVRSPLHLSREQVRLAPLRGELAGGQVEGGIVVNLGDGSEYTVDLQLTDGQVARLLEEAGTKAVIQGRLQLTTHLAGRGGLPTIKGDGQAEIMDGQLMEIPLLQLLASLFQIPELRQPRFSECRLEFTIADNRLQTPLIRVTAPKLQLVGQGTMSLDDYQLDHTFNLAVEKQLLARVPREIRAAFTQRADGYLAIDFKVKGPYDRPQCDLTQRLLESATEQLLQKGLQKLFR